jgi:hypothetical protein
VRASYNNGQKIIRESIFPNEVKSEAISEATNEVKSDAKSEVTLCND